MKPPEDLAGKLLQVNACERARAWLHEACDERRPLDAERHVSECPSCQRDAAVFKDLDQLLATEPPVQVPAELLPAVMQLVRADLARARRNARLAYAGAIAALLALAFGITFFDVANGAFALGRDALSMVELVRDAAPRTPDLRSVHVELPTLGYGWAALGVAALIVAAQVRFLTARRAPA